MTHETQRILIWAKTYPELSSNYVETVCTGGVREDGTPIRLYPVPLRYLSSTKRFKLYDWIETEIVKNPRDTRPESYKLRADSIRIVDHIDPDDHWRARRSLIFKDPSWQFGSLDELEAAQRASKRSLGIISVSSVEGVEVTKKSAADEAEFKRKLAQVHGQKDLFRKYYKGLEFLPYAIKLMWRCADSSCSCCDKPHARSVLDWGLLELARRLGPDTAKQRLEDLSRSSKDDLHIFAGNFFRHPHVFGIIGLWYPAFDPQGDLFDQAGTKRGQPSG